MALARARVHPMAQTLAAVATLLASPSLQAQDDPPPKVELFVGYSYLTDAGQDSIELPLGFSTSLAWNPSRRLGLVLDVDGHFNQRGGTIDFTEYGYLGGARYSWRGSRVTAYVELLAGAVRTSSTVRGVTSFGQKFTVKIDPTTDFAAQGGVGVDFRLSDRMAFRVSADFRNVLSDGESLRQFRPSAGLTFAFGGGSGNRVEPTPRTPVAPATFTPVETPPPAPAPRREAPPESRAAPERTPPTPERTTQERAPRVVTPEPAPRPAPATPAVPPTTDPLSLGRARLSTGDLSGAAEAFRQHLSRMRSRFTIAVGLFCDLANVAQATREAGGNENLLVVSVPRGGQPCYGVYWGLYESRAAAQQAIGSLPEGLRAGGPAVVPVSRLLR